MQMLLPLMYTLLFSFSLSPYPQPMEFRNNSPCTVVTNSLFLGAVDLSGNGLQGSPLLWQLLLKDRSWHPAAMSIFCPCFCSWPHNQSGLLVDPTDFFFLSLGLERHALEQKTWVILISKPGREGLWALSFPKLFYTVWWLQLSFTFNRLP